MYLLTNFTHSCGLLHEVLPSLGPLFANISGNRPLLRTQGQASTDLRDFMQSSQKAPPPNQEISESESIHLGLAVMLEYR